MHEPQNQITPPPPPGVRNESFRFANKPSELGQIDEPYFPFARDVDDNMLVVNCKNEAGYEWDLADGRGDEVERSITDYLEGYRNKLLENKYEYMDGDGCIEKAGGSSAPPPRGK